MSKCHCNTFTEKLTHCTKRVRLTQNQPWDTFSQQLCKWNKDIICISWWIWSLILNTTGCYRPGVSVHTLGGHVPIIVLLLLTWTRLGEAGLAHLTHSLNTGILSWIKLISFIQNKPLSTEFWRLCSWSHKSEDLLKTYIKVIQKDHNQLYSSYWWYEWRGGGI